MITPNSSNFLTTLPLYGLAASIGLFYQQIKTGVSKFIGLFIKKSNIPAELLEDV